MKLACAAATLTWAIVLSASAAATRELPLETTHQEDLVEGVSASRLGWIDELLQETSLAAGGTTIERPGQLAGSFELESGEVITGGPFVERQGDPFSFLYMDTVGLEKGALFRQEGPRTLVSVQPPGITIRFQGTNRLVWSGPDGDISGHRIKPHDLRPLTIRSNDATLDAQLLVPSCPGPHPLVVMVGGSGPATRWGGAFDTFFVSLGMAVLSYDKRGVGDPDWSEPDFETLAADAAAAIRMGSSQADIDRSRIGFWGSSQGGWIAPMAAARTNPNFLIVRVGPGVNDFEAVLHEMRQEMRAMGLSGIDLDHASALRRNLYELAVAGQPLAATDALVAPFVEEKWYRTAFGEGPVSGRWSQRWWSWAHRNLTVDPVPYLKRLDIPVLWFLAEKDENVPLVPSYLRLQEAFAASVGEDETLVTIPDANHAFLIRQAHGGLRYADGYFSRMKRWLGERGLSDEDCWGR